MVDTDKGFRLSSGREIPCAYGSLSTDGETLYRGYDHIIYTKAAHEYDDVEGGDWTPGERAEVADHMIAVWQAWKEAGK